MIFKNYRLYRTPRVGSTSNSHFSFGMKEIGISQHFEPTTIIIKARTDEEAMRKANKFWQDGDFGMGSITVVQEDK